MGLLFPHILKQASWNWAIKSQFREAPSFGEGGDGSGGDDDAKKTSSLPYKTQIAFSVWVSLRFRVSTTRCALAPLSGFVFFSWVFFMFPILFLGLFGFSPHSPEASSSRGLLAQELVWLVISLLQSPRKACCRRRRHRRRRCSRSQAACECRQLQHSSHCFRGGVRQVGVGLRGIGFRGLGSTPGPRAIVKCGIRVVGSESSVHCFGANSFRLLLSRVQ